MQAERRHWCSPISGSATFLGGINGRTPAALGPPGVRARAGLRPGELQPAQEHAGAQIDAGGLRADLRDLQDLPADPGQVPDVPLGIHRHRRGRVLRETGDDGGCHRRRGPRVPAEPRRGHPALQSDRHGGKLRGGLVRYPGQHLRQLARGVRQPPRQAVSLLPDSAQGGHEHRDAAHQHRAGAHARASCSSSPASTRVPASSASRSASRSARRCFASRAASSPRSPTSAPT